MGATPGRTDFRDQALSDAAIAVLQNTSEFAAGGVFPFLPVDEISGYYYILDRASFARAGAAPRPDNGELPEIAWKMSDDTYVCREWGSRLPIPNRLLSDPRMRQLLEMGSSEAVTRSALLRHEVNWASTFFATGIWNTTVTGGVNFVQWDDFANSTPELLLDTAKETVLLAGGMTPNVAVLGYRVAKRLRRHPRIIDMFRGVNGGTGKVTNAQLAMALDIERVVVLEAQKCTSADGQAVTTFDFVHGNHALVCYAAPNPGPLVASAGYTFIKNRNDRGNLQNQGMGVDVYRYQDVPRNSTILEASFDIAAKVIDAKLGYLFLDAVAS